MFGFDSFASIPGTAEDALQATEIVTEFISSRKNRKILFAGIMKLDVSNPPSIIDRLTFIPGETIEFDNDFITHVTIDGFSDGEIKLPPIILAVCVNRK